MNKIKTIQWMGLIPFLILILFLAILYFITGFNNAIFYILSLVIVTLMYFSTNLFFDNLFKLGEKTFRMM